METKVLFKRFQYRNLQDIANKNSLHQDEVSGGCLQQMDHLELCVCVRVCARVRVCVCARARVYDLWKMNLSRQLVLRMAQHTSLTMHTLFHYLTQQHSLTSLELGCSDTVKLL